MGAGRRPAPRHAPASLTHGLIQAWAAFLINRHLGDAGNPCRAVTEAAVVPASFKRSNARGADLAITCSSPTEDGWEITEPVFILEILSPSNEQDTRDNVWVYMTIPSVRQVVLLNSTSVRGELFQRGRDGAWPEEAVELSAGDAVRIEPIGFTCAVAEFHVRTSLARP